MRHFKTLAATALLAGSLSACTVNSGAASINTAELAADAGAVDFAAQAIEAIPSLSSHLSADQTAQINASLARIKTITAQINASSNGAITLDIGQGWAHDLATEFQTILSIAGPIAGAFSPAIAAYIATAQQIIPIIEAAVGLNTPYLATTMAPVSAPMLRAKLYQGT